ncbi:MAG: PRC-barrel domain-containing protein [Pararhizobium sp.]
MKTTLLRSAAASALLVGASLALPAASTTAFAQANTNNSTPAPADNGSTMKKDNGGSNMSTGSDATKPAPADNGGAAATPPASSTDTNTEKTPAPADDSSAANTATKPADTSTPADMSKPADGDKIVKEQQESQVLASTYIGQSVYNSNDKSIGDISDLVFDQSGGIQAAVIGVGGFLGIGQKDVAVKFDRIKIQRKPNSADVKLVTDMTADELKKAPAFKNLQTKMNEKNANQPPASGTTTGGSMGTTGGAAGGAGSMTPGAGTGGAAGGAQ